MSRAADKASAPRPARTRCRLRRMRSALNRNRP